MAWECLEIPPEGLDTVGKSGSPCLGCCPRDPTTDKRQKMDACMDERGHWFAYFLKIIECDQFGIFPADNMIKHELQFAHDAECMISYFSC